MSGTLYIVPTPIGNLGDMSARAIRTLEEADFIAAEDTRVTVKLLNHYGIKKELVTYHQHNMNARSGEILERLQNGESCALCTDAGTPAISDPGEQIVMCAAELGIPVVPIPGPCAAIVALCASGLSTGRFCFEGFIPVGKRGRRERLSELVSERRTLVFYEAPHKLVATLNDLYAFFGNRRITLARELTKLHEEIIRTDLSAARKLYAEAPPRGEFVLIVEGAPYAEKEEPRADCEQLIKEALDGGERIADACKRISELTGVPRNELYKIAMELKAE